MPALNDAHKCGRGSSRLRDVDHLSGSAADASEGASATAGSAAAASLMSVATPIGGVLYCTGCVFVGSVGTLEKSGFTYLQSMDFQREPQSKHHLYCEQEKPAHCHGSLLLRLGTHQIQNRTRGAHKINPHGTMTKRTPAVNWDHAVSWGGGLG